MGTIPDLAAIQEEHLEQTRKVTPQQTLRASSVGHPCDWLLWGSVKHWQKAEAPSPGLLAIFREGNRQEQHVLADLMAYGFEVEQGQRTLWSDQLKLSAHMECVLKLGGTSWLAEIKSMNPHIYERVNSIEDMLSASQYWLQGYPLQMEAYRWLAEAEGIVKHDRPALWVLKDKSSGALKSFAQDPDPELRARLVDRCQTINAHLDAGTEPPKLERVEVCENCRLRVVCAPDMERSGLEIYDDEELAELLGRRDELAEAQREYKRVDKKVKEAFKNVENAIVGGRWRVTGKESSGGGHTVAPWTSWKLTIKEV